MEVDMVAGRPIEGDAPKNVLLACRVEKDDDEQLFEMVRASGISKAQFIRAAIKIMLFHAGEAKRKSEEKARKMIQDGTLTKDAVNSLAKFYQDEMEKELRRMAYKQIWDDVMKKREKEKNSKT
jgi:hypothetical protein